MDKKITQFVDDQNLEEKVLQFGTGVLLRGLSDFVIDKANKKGIFNGRIVVVKSTDGGELAAFEAQKNAYTLVERGVENGKIIDQTTVCTAISRVVSAKSAWKEVLECAKNPAMQIVISNTTELGLRLEADDDIFAQTPNSFPAKLLSFLHARYMFFSGSETAGMIIVPTELIPNNGLILKQLVNKLAEKQDLDSVFLTWLNTHNSFCNSLVDRIVPGKPSGEDLTELTAKLGYEDRLLAMSESYLLWAIEGDERVKNILSFAQADERVIIAENIDRYRELKLRLLNGTHTFCCGLAYLLDFKTVKEALQNADFEHFIKNLMLQELVESIPYPIQKQEAENFALQVLDRFRNPYIAHLWLNITFAYTSKMEMRCLPMIVKAVKNQGNIPPFMARGFAAYCRFTETDKKNENGQFVGNWNGENYVINDAKAEFFHQNKEEKNEKYFYKILINKNLWQNSLDTELDDATLQKISKTIFEAYQKLT